MIRMYSHKNKPTIWFYLTLLLTISFSLFAVYAVNWTDRKNIEKNKAKIIKYEAELEKDNKYDKHYRKKIIEAKEQIDHAQRRIGDHMDKLFLVLLIHLPVAFALVIGYINNRNKD